jgi:hypothetical protein
MAIAAGLAASRRSPQLDFQRRRRIAGFGAGVFDVLAQRERYADAAMAFDHRFAEQT